MSTQYMESIHLAPSQQAALGENKMPPWRINSYT